MDLGGDDALSVQGGGVTIEFTRREAELVIAVMVFAEGAAPELSPPIAEALKDLRSWRSALLQVYLKHVTSGATA